ncbi:MAG: CHAT domain-containing protein, partial [Ardenticatenaceae bacterium]
MTVASVPTSVTAQSYETFELLIGSKQTDGYPVIVIKSPAGEPRSLCWLNPQHEKLLGCLRHIKNSDTNAAFLREFGSNLFEYLFAGPIEPLYRESLGMVRGQGKSLRVRLRINSPELAALPWEFLYDREKGSFLAISPDTVLVRDVSMNEPDHPTAVEAPLRVLVVISNPLNELALNVQQEKQTIQEALKGVVSQGIVKLKIVEKATMANISQAMRTFSPHVFHYVGHAAFSGGQGVIMLENDHEFSRTIDETPFSTLFSPSVRIAVLNACQTGTTSSSNLLAGLAPNLLKHELSAVVGMQYPIADRAALIFSREFYRTLALGAPIEAAVSEARKGIFRERGEGQPDWGTPVLFLRAENGEVLKVRRSSTSDVSSPPEPERPPQIEGFVGRKAELAYFAQALNKSGAAVISGMAGTGKT